MEQQVEATAHSTFWPGTPRGGQPSGKPREPLHVLVFTVLTLGVYHFYYHAVSHAELLQHCGRKNRELPVVFAYMGSIGYALILGGSLWILPLFVAVASFVYLVRRQFETLDETRGHLGLEPVYPMRAFFLWLVPGALLLVGPFVAYKRLIESYNEVWVEMARTGDTAAHEVVQADPSAVARATRNGHMELAPANDATDRNGAAPRPAIQPVSSLRDGSSDEGRPARDGREGAFEPPLVARVPSNGASSNNGSTMHKKGQSRPEAKRKGGTRKPGAFCVRDHRQWKDDP